jgi:hypothetical protein
MNPDVPQQTPVPVEQLPKQPPEVKSVTPSQPVTPNTTVGLNKQIPGIKRKVPRLMLILMIFAFAIFLLIIVFIIGKLSTPASNKTACTLEAKVCPDGTSVIRTGPNCEFEPCPSPAETPSVTADWKIYTDPLYSIKYPQTWTLVNSPENQQIEIYYQPDLTQPVGSIAINEGDAASLGSLSLFGQDKIIGGLSAKCKSESNTELLCYLSSDNEYISFLITSDKAPSYNQTLDEILSTFKFIEATPVASPAASPSASLTASPSSSPTAAP